jgi:hypothetical protein
MKNKKIKKFLLFSFIVTASFACGIKGPPLPPLETIQTSESNAKAIESQKTPTSLVSGDATKKK